MRRRVPLDHHAEELQGLVDALPGEPRRRGRLSEQAHTYHERSARERSAVAERGWQWTEFAGWSGFDADQPGGLHSPGPLRPTRTQVDGWGDQSRQHLCRPGPLRN